MRVYDCFPYWREQWAIELRLRLWAAAAPDIEYCPIAFYGDRTQRGEPLPEPEKDPRCLWVKVVLDGPSSWHREHQQRDAVTQIRDAFRHDDLILLCDADEIVDPTKVEQIVEHVWPTDAFLKLSMTMFMFGARWRFPDPWRHPGAFFARSMPPHPTAQIRLHMKQSAIGAAGWHFSHVGDLPSKLKACAHEEVDTPEYLAQLQQGLATGTMGPYQLFDLPLEGLAGDLFREIVDRAPERQPVDGNPAA